MALLVGEHAARTLRIRLSELVARTPGRGEFALRLALVCTLATWVAQIYGTPDAALTAYIAFFMNKPDRTSSVLISVVFTVLISVIIGLLMLIAGVALDTPPLRVAIMATLSLSLLFLASASKLKPVASIIALILVYALDLLGKVPQGELATRALLYAWLFVGIPAGVTVGVNMLIGPTPRQLAERAIAHRLRAAQTLLASPEASARKQVAMLREEDDAEIRSHVRLAMMEKVSLREDLLALQQAINSTATLLMLAEAIDRAAGVPDGWRQTAATTLGDMATILEQHRYPVDIAPVSITSASVTETTSSLVADFNDVLANFAIAQPPSAKAKAKGGFFVADAFTNLDHVRFAIKVTMAAMGCYLFYSLTDWQGIHTCLITCYIVALDTVAETVEKLVLRIAGALLGAAAGLASIVWILPSLDGIGGLLALVFAGSLAGTWIAAGSPRIGYAGFQFAFAFFLCVIQGSAPAFDLTVARDRVVGILLGIAAIYVIFTYVWPVSIVRRIDAAIAALLRQLGGIARLARHAERCNALPAAHIAASKVETYLGMAYYEPASLRPSIDWFKRRQVLLTELSRLESKLLLSDDRPTLATMAGWFDQAASDIDKGEISANPVTGGNDRMEQDLAH